MRGIDATVLTLLLNEQAGSPPDPTTGMAIPNVRDRVNFLISTLEKEKQKLIIPTPVLAEVLVVSGTAGLRYIEILQRSSVFEIKDFDKLAAIELALMTRNALESGNKRNDSPDPYQKIKIDRQIVAICKVSDLRPSISSRFG